MKRGAESSAHTVAAAVAVAAFLLYVATLCPTVPFGDGGELIAAAQRLGVAHPPGYPLYTLLGWLALKVPFGEPAARMNLLSALLGALACGGVALLVRRWTESGVAAAASGLVLATSATFWSVAVVTEVYTLHLLFLVMLLLLAATAGQTGDALVRRRTVLTGAVVLGAGLSHHPTIVLALPALVVLAWHGRGVRLRASAWLVAAAVVVAIPCGFAWTLLLRAQAHTAVNWGDPETLGSLWAHVTARRYAGHDLGWEALTQARGWWLAVRLLAWDAGVLCAPLALLGAFASRPPPRARAALALLAAATVLFGLRYSAEDVEVFYLPAVLALSVSAGIGVAAIERGRWRWSRHAAIAAALLLIALPLASHWRSKNLRGSRGAALYARDLLASVPYSGVLFLEGDDSFPLAYRVLVLGERPDVTFYDRNGNLFRDLLREPGSARRAGESPEMWRTRREIEFLESQRASAEPRTVTFLSWPGYDLPPQMRFEPVGVLYRVRDSGDAPVEDGALWAGYHEDAIRAEALRTGDRFARTVAAGYPLLRGERALFLGRRDEALARFEDASRIAGASETIHNYLGAVYGRLGEYARAVSEFEQAVRIQPVSVRGWNNLGRARMLMGERAGAARAWRRSLEIRPGQPDVIEQLRSLGERP